MHTTAPRPALTLQYGPHAPQTIECWDPDPGQPCHGAAVLVHGGYWRARFDASLMEPLVRDLTAHGWAVANVEYRRGGNGGGWPATLEDVQAAVDAVAATPWRAGWSGPLLGIGHSVGGQLVLLAAGRLDAVVALAPVTDAARTWREGLGENAAAEFFGSSPGQDPATYEAASPVWQLPVGVPLLVVHGASDQRVPVEHSQDYLVAARGAGDQVDFYSPHELDHLAAIDPATPTWERVRHWLETTADQFRASSSSPA
ncbi:prolyl oligopeptidase family serine peptidase [Arthrobacter sp. I2-34]|uniref:Prolyl oligopeptidase family serine peptidase n=1 Tax=Arthrobacter hankyongi TaxID=2904801 RepID=A0ABS9LB79_9MICC|nr:prolyl oligopeptidase family serine peptidase [Arthrobacter hankyongi]MCG2623949.1 prolyl oligopeptidase family serine peptidase [Arthrobacter hankyongi]